MQFVKLHTQKNTFSESDVAKIRDYWTIGSTSIFVSQQKKEKKGFQQEKVTPDVKSIVKTFDPKTNNISKNERGFFYGKSGFKTPICVPDKIKITKKKYIFQKTKKPHLSIIVIMYVEPKETTKTNCTFPNRGICLHKHFGLSCTISQQVHLNFNKNWD